jgi:hypothetical protein
MSRWRLALKLLYVVAVSAVLLFLAVKIVRVRGAQRRFAALPDYGEVHRFDPEREGGHLLPNLRQLVKTERPSDAVTFITNSKGFRNEEEFALEHPASTYRVMFLGDSYVDGMRTDQRRTIGYLLQESLNRSLPAGRYTRVEVMISGHNNPTNAWYYFQHHGYRYKPDLVLLGVTIGNDLAWNNYRATFVPVRDGQGRPALEKSDRPWQDEHKGEGLMIPEEGYVSDRSGAERCAKELKTRQSLAEKSRLFGYAVPPALYPFPSAPGKVFATDFCVCLGLFYVPVMPEIEKIYADFEETLAGFDDTVVRNGSRFAVVLFPERIQLAGTDWELLRRLFLLDGARFDLEYPDRRLLAFCKQHGIASADALPWLKEPARAHPWTHLFRSRGDMHYNEAGQRVAAAGLDGFVRTLIASPDPPATTGGASPGR